VKVRVQFRGIREMQQRPIGGETPDHDDLVMQSSSLLLSDRHEAGPPLFFFHTKPSGMLSDVASTPLRALLSMARWLQHLRRRCSPSFICGFLALSLRADMLRNIRVPALPLTACLCWKDFGRVTMVVKHLWFVGFLHDSLHLSADLSTFMH
jgi:hypothetical protein